MDNVLHIRWDTGRMDIVMDKFFPCSIATFNKLLKVIHMDWQHENELLQTLQQFFREQVTVWDGIYQERGKAYWEYVQDESDTKKGIDSRKHPNGVRLTKDELKAWKEHLRYVKSKKNTAKADATKAKRQKEWYEGRANDNV